MYVYIYIYSFIYTYIYILWLAIGKVSIAQLYDVVRKLACSLDSGATEVNFENVNSCEPRWLSYTAHPQVLLVGSQHQRSPVVASPHGG